MSSRTADSDRRAPTTARWVAAVICIVYGFAKVNGSQFTILDSELTRPLGSVSGFWLTWYYFGYSPFYATVLALAEIIGGVLLIVPRTSLAAALGLLPIAVNIVLIDIFYGVDAGGTLAAILLFACLCAVIAPFAGRLRAAVLLSTLPARPSTTASAALLALVVAGFAFTWWGANYNNRAPTPIDGVWSVVSPDGSSPAEEQWHTVFFEHNRAHLAVFRSSEGPDEKRHFELGPDGVVRVWSEWLTKGPLLMEGRLMPDSEIHLRMPAADGGSVLRLRRAQPNVGPHPRFRP